MSFDFREKRSQGSVHMDAIRGMAAFVVMLGHSRDLFFQSLNGTPAATATVTATAAVAGQTTPHPSSRPQITIGNEAVMIFFVLSGYLVGGSVLRAFQRRKWSWKEYLTKRLSRLWMVLLPALVLTVVLDHAGLRLFPQATSIYHGPAGQSEVAPNLLRTLSPHILLGNVVFVQNILVSTPGTNIPLWSLSNEFWYYLAFPLLLLACWPSSSTRLRVVAGVSLAALLYFIGFNEAILFPTWLLGSVISLLPLRLGERTSRWLMAGLGLLLVPVLLLVRRMPLDLHVAQTIVAVYFGLVLYVVLNRKMPAARGLYQRVASVLSDLSYPLYLVHLPILVLLCAIVNRPWHHWSKTPAHFALLLGMDAVAVVVAYGLHLCFQRHTERVRKACLRLLQREQPVLVAAD